MICCALASNTLLSSGFQRWGSIDRDVNCVYVSRCNVNFHPSARHRLWKLPFWYEKAILSVKKGTEKYVLFFLPGIWSSFIFLDPGFCIVHTSERYNMLPGGPQESVSQILFWSRDSTEHNFAVIAYNHIQFWYICVAHQKAGAVKTTKNGGGKILGCLKMGAVNYVI